jgi:hypothetical protein
MSDDPLGSDESSGLVGDSRGPDEGRLLNKCGDGEDGEVWGKGSKGESESDWGSDGKSLWARNEKETEIKKL